MDQIESRKYYRYLDFKCQQIIRRHFILYMKDLMQISTVITSVHVFAFTDVNS